MSARPSGVERWEVRAGLAAAAACTTAAGLYAVLRLVQTLLVPEPDPALVLYSEHSGFFWRAWTSLYIAGTVAFLTWVASTRDAARVAAVLARAVPVATALLAAQALLVP